MPRCTLEERIIDLCLCDFRDCQLDVAAVAHNARVFVVENSPDPIPVPVALALLKAIKAVEKIGYEECITDLAHCRGIESVPLKPYSPQQKAVLKNSSDVSWRHGVARIITSIAIREAGPSKKGAVAFSIAVFGTALGVAGQKLRDLADDPIDQEYLEIPTPVLINLPDIIEDDFIGDVEVSILNELMKNQARGVSLASSLVSAVNRAQGAEAAGDSDSRDRQLSAAREFSMQWADIIVEAAELRSAAAVALSGLGIDFSISAQETLQIQSDIVASGWPPEIIDIVALFDVGSERQTAFLRKATSLLNGVPALKGSLGDMFNHPGLAAQEGELIAVLREFGMAQ